MSNIDKYRRADVISPEGIANNLESVVDMIRDQVDPETMQMVRRVVGLAARNTRALFEFEMGDDNRMRPKNVGQMMFLVDMIMMASLAPDSYGDDPAKVFIGLQKSMEIGGDLIGGLANIMIVNKRASIWGDLALALVSRSGKLAQQKRTHLGTPPTPGLELEKWDDGYGWRTEYWRVGEDEPYAAEYTVADAKRARLWMNTKKQPWIISPDRMLFNRARAFALRDGFSDCLYGMSIAEEQHDIVREEVLAPPQLAGPADDDEDEPVTAEDTAARLPDYGDTSELPLDDKPTEGQGDDDGQQEEKASE